MNLPNEKDLSDLFGDIMNGVKEVSVAVKEDPVDKNVVISHLNKINAAANLGKAVMFYRASQS